jgi:hypothetical protein
VSVGGAAVTASKQRLSAHNQQRSSDVGEVAVRLHRGKQLLCRATAAHDTLKELRLYPRDCTAQHNLPQRARHQRRR